MGTAFTQYISVVEQIITHSTHFFISLFINRVDFIDTQKDWRIYKYIRLICVVYIYSLVYQLQPQPSIKTLLRVHRTHILYIHIYRYSIHEKGSHSTSFTCILYTYINMKRRAYVFVCMFVVSMLNVMRRNVFRTLF